MKKAFHYWFIKAIKQDAGQPFLFKGLFLLDVGAYH